MKKRAKSRGSAPAPVAFRAYPPPPRRSNELLVAVRDLETEDVPVFADNPTQFQVHLAGSAAALKELGSYLVALSRSKTTDPELYESLNDVCNADGGTVRLIVRRLGRPPERLPRTPEYKSGACR